MKSILTILCALILFSTNTFAENLTPEYVEALKEVMAKNAEARELVKNAVNQALEDPYYEKEIIERAKLESKESRTRLKVEPEKLGKRIKNARWWKEEITCPKEITEQFDSEDGTQEEPWLTSKCLETFSDSSDNPAILFPGDAPSGS